MTANVQDVVDYIVLKLSDDRSSLTLLKLQKLLYYVQAWALVVLGRRAFDSQFQAWVHGPVCRVVYDRFRNSHSLYDVVDASAIRADFQVESIDDELRIHIDDVLETYAGFTGSQLEAMTHKETPWIEARKGLPAAVRCENDLDEGAMRQYYSRLLDDVTQEQAAAK